MTVGAELRPSTPDDPPRRMREWLAVALVVVVVQAALYIGFLLFTGRFVIGAAALTHPVGDYWVTRAQTVSCFKDIPGTDEVQVVVTTGANVRDVDAQVRSETPAAIDVAATGLENVFLDDGILSASLQDRIVHLSEPRGNRPLISGGQSIEVCSDPE